MSLNDGGSGGSVIVGSKGAVSRAELVLDKARDSDKVAEEMTAVVVVLETAVAIKTTVPMILAGVSRVGMTSQKWLQQHQANLVLSHALLVLWITIFHSSTSRVVYRSLGG